MQLCTDILYCSISNNHWILLAITTNINVLSCMLTSYTIYYTTNGTNHWPKSRSYDYHHPHHHFLLTRIHLSELCLKLMLVVCISFSILKEFHNAKQHDTFNYILHSLFST